MAKSVSRSVHVKTGEAVIIGQVKTGKKWTKLAKKKKKIGKKWTKLEKD